MRLMAPKTGSQGACTIDGKPKSLAGHAKVAHTSLPQDPGKVPVAAGTRGALRTGATVGYLLPLSGKSLMGQQGRDGAFRSQLSDPAGQGRGVVGGAHRPLASWPESVGRIAKRVPARRPGSKNDCGEACPLGQRGPGRDEAFAVDA